MVTHKHALVALGTFTVRPKPILFTARVKQCSKSCDKVRSSVVQAQGIRVVETVARCVAVRRVLGSTFAQPGRRLRLPW